MSHDPLPAPVEFHVTDQNSDALRQARAKVALVVAQWRLPLSQQALSDLKLCTSEVIANALEHASGECWVRVFWTGEHVEVQVRDCSARLPNPCDVDEDAESGRGLSLVAALARSWGWEPRGRGKVVFFSIGPDETPDRRLGVLLGLAALPTETSSVVMPGAQVPTGLKGVLA
ncbi:ATP-binding protein [Kitasatospora acidiphila]|uniref:ATP-binding protein n=1 Tax=Kitasatospora acidiphila TaxID=2567942 RepID=UPI0015F050B7|nr:ATP-binding protein [Kitasatospora acidiphila]